MLDISKISKETIVGVFRPYISCSEDMDDDRVYEIAKHLTDTHSPVHGLTNDILVEQLVEIAEKGDGLISSKPVG